MRKKHFESKNLPKLQLLILGIGFLSLTLSVFVTSTFAWFAVSSNPGVGNFHVSFDKNEDFALVAAKKGNDKIYLKDEDGDTNIDSISLEGYGNYEKGDELGLVTSSFQNRWLKEGIDSANTLPILRSSYYSPDFTNMPPIAGDGFFQFEFFFYSARDTYLYLAPSTFIVADHEANLITASKSTGLYSAEDLDQAAKAARVSFFSGDVDVEDGKVVEKGTTFKIFEPNVSKPSNTRFGGRLDLNGDGDYDFSNGKEVLFGECSNKDKIVYGGDIDKTLDVFNGNTREGVSPLNLKESISNGLEFASESTFTLNQLGLDDGTNPLLYIPAKTEQRLVVTIYLEGWDAQATNAIGYSTLNIKLAFNGLYKSKGV